ncbi:hypothetical protein [Rhodococcus sp. SMB37]|uniref:hypothetical protein n=1 Tax=Rhodococcus sp. SMB37 TaxID=2512213 RepID=UPI0010530E8B|nr:hypothetical protein [Rhodococcus sp. SMB37]
MPVSDFAIFGFTTAIWAMGVAFTGSSIGTRVMRDLVDGASRILLGQRELFSCGLTVALASIVSFLYTGDALITSLIGLSLLASIGAEVASYVSLGRGKKWTYACSLVIRNLGGLVFGGVVLIDEGQTVSIQMVLAGMIVSSVVAVGIQVREAPKIVRMSNLSAVGFVGATNLVLWVIAAGDRVILGFTVDATQLATYSLIYGLADRAFRVTNSTYVSSTMPVVLAGGAQRWAKQYRLVVTILGITIAMLSPVMVDWISGGRYSVDLGLPIVLVGALAFYALSGPDYVECVRLNKVRELFVPIAVTAAASYILLWFLSPHVGYYGAAFCKLVCYAVWFFLTIYVVRKWREVGIEESSRTR